MFTRLCNTMTIAASAALLGLAPLAHAGGPGTSFSYQGTLKNNGLAVTNDADFIFRIYDAASGGSLIGTDSINGVSVTGGVFTVDLDFGAGPFSADQALWLDIQARTPAGSGSFTTLTPRQRLGSATHSLSTRGLNVLSNGNAAVGTNANGSRFSVLSAFSGVGMIEFMTNNGGDVRYSGGDDGEFYYEHSGDASGATSFGRTGGERLLTIVNSGAVGIGTSAPDSRLQVDTNGENAIRVTSNNGATELMNVGPGGELRLANVAHRFGGGVGFSNVLLNLSAEDWDFGLNISGGDAGKPGGGSWANTSDERLKKNIHDLDGALDTLLALRGVTFEYKDPTAIGELDGVRTGFIAQDVEQVIPDWVWTATDGYKRITIRGFEALAVESLRELDDENRALRDEVTTLEARLAALEAALVALQK